MRISQYEDNRFKVRKGRIVHEERSARNRQYLRKKIPTIKKETDVYLADPLLGIRGIVDEILHLKDGSLSPVDYKFTPYKNQIFRTHKYQLILYGLLIEKNYGKDVNRGYVAYIRGGSKTCEVVFTSKLKENALAIIQKIMQIIRDEKLPPRTKYKIRCSDCCYKNICA